MREELVRQSFLGVDSDEILAAAHVGIVGLGGGGSHVAQQFGHVGIGSLTLFDRDRAEASNLNRLIGATRLDVDVCALKVDIAARGIRSVNPAVRVRPIPGRWQDHALVLRECDVIVGCVDSFSERWQLEAAARAALIPYIDIGMDVHQAAGRYAISGQVALSMPGHLCLRCMGILTEAGLAREQYGAAGERPQVVWPNGLLASAAVGVVMELLTPWFPGPSSVLLRFEGNAQELTSDRWLKECGQQATCSHYPLAEVGDRL